MLKKIFGRVESDDSEQRAKELRSTLTGVTQYPLQTSPYWNSWKRSKTYRFVVLVFGAVIEAENKSIATQAPDLYGVVYLTRDRNGTKQKTHLERRNYRPVWNDSLVFSGVDYLEQFTVELKTPNMLMSENPCLGSIMFTVAEIAAMSNEEMRMKDYDLISEKSDFHGKISLGFTFDPSIPGDYFSPIPFYEGDDFSAHVPLYYTVKNGGFVSLALYTDPQVVPWERAYVSVGEGDDEYEDKDAHE